MFAHDVLKTLYSPVKAFEEIVKDPDIKGPLLILVLVLILSASLQYVMASKISVEIGKPEEDDWTESIYLWASNGEISNSSDRVVGNYSVMSSVANDTCIWMRLTGIEPINCSGDESCKRLSFRIKWTHPNESFPDCEATLMLFFNDENGCLKRDLSTEISDSRGNWYNSTVDIGPESLDWNHTSSSEWENVTGLEFRLAWSVPTNLTMKIDDLYFGRYVLASVAFPINGWLIEFLMFTGASFLLSWGIYGGLFLLFIKMFGEEVGSWKAFFIVVGYLFAVIMVYLAARTLSITMLPETPMEMFDETWYPTCTRAVGFIGCVWMAALSVIALRSFYAFSWRKAVVISIVANIVNYFLNPFMLMYF